MAEGVVTIESDGRIYVRLGASDDEVREAGLVIFQSLADNPKLIERNNSLTVQRNMLMAAIVMIRNEIDSDSLKEALGNVIAKCASLEPKNELPAQH